MTPRPGLLVQESLLPSALRVCSHWGVLGALPPELHVIQGDRTFLTAAQASGLGIPPDCLDYRGTFLDALQEGRLEWVLPLTHDRSGIWQGMLEFCCVPYLGSGMTGTLLASRRDPLEGVLRSLGIPIAASPPQILVALVGNEDPWIVPSDDEKAVTLARILYKELGLAGWALVGLARSSDHWAWASLETLPDLREGGVFSNLLEAAGVSFDQVLGRVLQAGLAWHTRETDLKIHYKDRI